MIKIGLLVNPIAGMGGNVGLKGTDGKMYKKALDLGAEPITPGRIKEVLKLITRQDIKFLVPPKSMGENYIKNFSFDYKVIGKIKTETTEEDTKKLAKQILDEGADVLIFVGGDGTARNVLDAVETKIPLVGVPSGVKMFSSVFTFSPRAAAEMINNMGDDFIEKEVLDIDEDAFRENRLEAKYYGTVIVPNLNHLLQGKKSPSSTKHSIKEEKKRVAQYVLDNMNEDYVYILGPGTTVREITDTLNVDKTLLGIDAIHKGELIGRDINEKEMLKIIHEYKKVKIIITPIGGNGFIFGRGSKQISSKILENVGKENTIIVSTIDKVGNLEYLRIDSGDYEVDKSYGGLIDVIIGYNDMILLEVKF